MKRPRTRKLQQGHSPPLSQPSSVIFFCLSHNLISFLPQTRYVFSVIGPYFSFFGCSFFSGIDYLILFAGNEHSIVTIESSGILPDSTAAETVRHIQKTRNRGQVKTSLPPRRSIAYAPPNLN
jgi:hypothetical protein